MAATARKDGDLLDELVGKITQTPDLFDELNNQREKTIADKAAGVTPKQVANYVREMQRIGGSTGGKSTDEIKRMVALADLAAQDPSYLSFTSGPDRSDPIEKINQDVKKGLTRGGAQVQRQVGGTVAGVSNRFGFDSATKLGERLIADADRQLEQIGDTKTAAGPVAEAIPSFGAALLAGMATGGAGAGPVITTAVGALTAGAQSGGAEYADVAQRTRERFPQATDQQVRDIATGSALSMGVFSAITNTIPMGRYVARVLPAGVVGSVLTRLSGNAAVRSLVDMAAEGVQEASEELWSAFMAQVAQLDPEAYRGIVKRMAVAGGVGAALGAAGPALEAAGHGAAKGEVSRAGAAGQSDQLAAIKRAVESRLIADIMSPRNAQVQTTGRVRPQPTDPGSFVPEGDIDEPVTVDPGAAPRRQGVDRWLSPDGAAVFASQNPASAATLAAMDGTPSRSDFERAGVPGRWTAEQRTQFVGLLRDVQATPDATPDATSEATPTATPDVPADAPAVSENAVSENDLISEMQNATANAPPAVQSPENVPAADFDPANATEDEIAAWLVGQMTGAPATAPEAPAAPQSVPTTTPPRTPTVQPNLGLKPKRPAGSNTGIKPPKQPPATAPTASPGAPPAPVADAKPPIFSDATRAAKKELDDALADLFKKGRGKLYSAVGPDPELVGAAAVVVAKAFKTGIHGFADLVRYARTSLPPAAMVKLRPLLENAWDRLQAVDRSGRMRHRSETPIDDEVVNTESTDDTQPEPTPDRTGAQGDVRAPADAVSDGEDREPAPDGRAPEAPRDESADAAPGAEGGGGARAGGEGGGGADARGGTAPADAGVSADGGARDGGAVDADADERPGDGGRGSGDGARGTDDSRVAAGDYRISPETIAAIESAGEMTRARNNVAAIELATRLKAEGRPATIAEQEVLARYVGWGALKSVFAKNPSKAMAPIQSRLKELLTEEQYNEASRSTQYAHYTSFTIVEAMWKMAEQMGFKGGRVLEPSMGIGNFITGRPAGSQGEVRLTGVELDPITATIAALLLPRSNVNNAAFQDVTIADNSIDLAIGNPPFSEVTIYDRADKRHNDIRPQLHDYFFLKSLDRVRPGGLLMFITSTGTMDKQDSRVRQKLSESADLVAAVRLPGGAFESNAGTEVVTDLVILRKRLPGENASGPAWLKTTSVPDPDGKDPIIVNEYFASNPDQILGRLDRSGTMYRGDSKNVSKTGDFQERFEAAIARLPRGVMSDPSVANTERLDASPEPTTDVKAGVIVKKDGKLWQSDGTQLVEMELTKQAQQKTERMMAIRDALETVIRLQLEGAGVEDKDSARAALGRAYTSFVSQYSYLNQPSNFKLLDGDPSNPRLMGLETDIQYKRDKNGRRTGSIQSVKKADLFTRDTIGARKPLESTDSLPDAFAAVLSERGRVDLDEIGRLTNRSPEDIGRDLVVQQLAFQDPEAGWVDRTKYLSGNVRAKLAKAKESAKADEKYRPNVEALERVQPADLPFEEISIKLGAPWVSAADYAQFGADMLSTTPRAFVVNHVGFTGRWVFGPQGKGGVHAGTASTETWGTPDMAFFEIVEKIMNGGDLSVYDNHKLPDGQKVRVLNKDKTAAVQSKAREIQNEFQDWMLRDDERRTRLHRLYNDTMNNMVVAKYDGSHLRLPGSTPDITLRQHQLNAVWRIVQEGRAILGHEVGTGKTFTMVAAAMELKRLGLASKPTISVLKSTFPGFVREAGHLYPGAKILALDSFDAKSRKRFQAQIAQGDWDLVIMTHEVMSRLNVKPEVEQDFINQQLAELEKAIDESRALEGKKSATVKDLERAKERLENRLKEMLDQKRDDVVNFEDTGIDHLFVDEAHLFKSLPYYTTRGRVRGIDSGEDSQRAIGMYLRSQYLMQKQGYRGVVFATGTPISNSLGELYTMQRYLQPDLLAERNQSAFDSWANAWANIENKIEITAGQQYKSVPVLTGFSNVPELRMMAEQVMDIQLAEDMPYLKRPARKEIKVELEMDDDQRAERDRLLAWARSVQGTREAFVEMGKITTAGRKFTLDTRMVNPKVSARPTRRAAQIARRVMEVNTDFPGSTQMIFTNLRNGGQDNPDYSFIDDIIGELMLAGIPREKIIDFSDLTGDAKGKAAQMLYDGEALIGIGSTATAGTGVNAQGKLKALHHADVPWKPADIEQRDGRGIRQGNEHEEVFIYRYVTKGSFDEFVWTKVTNKAKGINQFMRGDATSRTIEDGDVVLSFEEMVAAASENQLALERIDLTQLKQELEAAEQSHRRSQIRLRDSRLTNGVRLKAADEDLARVDAMIEQATKTEGEKFSMLVGDKEFTDRDAANKAMAEKFEGLQKEKGARLVENPEPVGAIRGFTLVAGYQDIIIRLGDREIERFSWRPDIDYVASLAGRLNSRRLTDRRNDAMARIEQIKKDIESSESMIGRKFAEADALRVVTETLAEIELRLTKEEKAPIGARKRIEPFLKRKAGGSGAASDGGAKATKAPPPVSVWDGRAKAFPASGTTLSTTSGTPSVGKPLSEHAIAATMARAFDVPMAVGRVAQRDAAGIYKPHSQAIRFKPKWAGDLGVVTHETAHHIDETTDVLKSLTPGMKLELQALDYDPMAARIDEGFAEFIRHLLTQDDARWKAPEFYQWFTQTWLPAHADVESKLADARRLVDQWRMQTPEQRVAANISKTGKPEGPIGVPLRERAAEWIGQAWDRVYAQWKNEGNYLSKFQEEAIARGLKMKPGDRPYALYSALNQAGPTMAHSALMDKGVFSVTGDMRKLGPSLADVMQDITSDEYDGWVRWVYARHAIESHIKGKDPGISLEDAQAVFNANATNAKWKKAADALTELNNSLIEMLGDAGVLTDEDVTNITEFYQTYVPLMRVRPGRLLGRKGVGGHKLVNLGKPVRGRKGAKLQIVDPVEATVERAVRFYTRALQQQVIQSIVMAERKVSGLGDWVQPVPPGIKRVDFSLDEIRDQLESLGVDPVELDAIDPTALLFMYRADYTIKGGEPVAMVVIDGKRQLYEFDHDLYRAVSGMNRIEIPFFVDILFGVPARLMRLGATGLNPDFAAANLIRDYATFLFQTKEAGDGRGAALVPKMIGSYIWSEVQRTVGHEGDPIVELWKEMGGELSTKVGLDRKELRGTVRDAMRSETKRRAIKAVTNPVDALRKVVNITEVGPRIAEFLRALERRGYDRAKVASLRSKGMQPPRDVLIEAINAANDVTVNFRRMGYFGKYANQSVAFFNAALEGPDKMVRTIRDPSTRKRAFVRLAVLAATTMAFWYWRRDDDDYKEQEPWLKYGFWTFAKDGKTVVRVPRPFEYGWLVASGVEAILNTINDRDPKTIKGYLAALVNRLAPNVLPSVVIPAVETAFNYDTFRDRDIVSDQLRKNLPKDQYTPETTELMKAIGAELDISPARIEHLVNQSTGGLYRRVARSADILVGGRRGEIADVPGLGGVTVRSESSVSVGQFYKELTKAEQRYNSARKHGEPAEAIKARFDLLGEYAEIMRDIRKMIPEGATRDERFAYERFIIGLARDATGQEQVARYPSLFGNPPADADPRIDGLRREILGRWIYQATSPNPERHKGETLAAFQERQRDHKASTGRARAWLSRTSLGDADRLKMLEREARRRGFKTDSDSFRERRRAAIGM